LRVASQNPTNKESFCFKCDSGDDNSKEKKILSGTSFDLYFTVILELLSAHDRGYIMLHPGGSTQGDSHISHTINLSIRTYLHTYIHTYIYIYIYIYSFKDPLPHKWD